MIEPKFTPAPWVIYNEVTVGSERGVLSDYLKAESDDYWRIAQCFFDNETLDECGDMSDIGYDEMKANAHLIKTSPKLYDMLSKVKNYMEDAWQEHLGDISYEDIDGILAEARGEL